MGGQEGHGVLGWTVKKVKGGRTEGNLSRENRRGKGRNGLSRDNREGRNKWV